ncbi:MAG TPA: hypothetical protein VN238_06530 [Solirubrobacteraceae bacterium]|nr:hypothetical protein [Solirubrobacteraceae bacterium]
MLAELPFTTAEAIAAEYKPGVRLTSKAAIRTLRSKSVVSDGVSIRPRREHGRVAGGQHIYSALNLDAVRLYRRGDEAAARKIAERAQALERGDGAARLAKALADEPEPVVGSGWMVFRTSNYDGVLEKALAELSQATEHEREAMGDAVDLGRATFARVVKVHSDVVELRLDEGGATVPLPAHELPERMAPAVGSVVALRWEDLGAGMTLLKAAPAFETGARSGPAYPYDRPLLGEEPPTVVEGILASAPTIRRPRAIPIRGVS